MKSTNNVIRVSGKGLCTEWASLFEPVADYEIDKRFWDLFRIAIARNFDEVAPSRAFP